jgi:hypothetical protein
MTEPVGKAYERQEVRPISKLNHTPLGCALLAHAGPTGINVAGPREFPLMRSQPEVGIDMAQFMSDPAL